MCVYRRVDNAVLNQPAPHHTTVRRPGEPVASLNQPAHTLFTRLKIHEKIHLHFIISEGTKAASNATLSY